MAAATIRNDVLAAEPEAGTTAGAPGAEGSKVRGTKEVGIPAVPSHHCDMEGPPLCGDPAPQPAGPRKR